MVPATTMTSHCRGAPRMKLPMRSMSTRPAWTDINSMPQHDVAIGKTHRLLVLAHVSSLSIVVTPMSRPGTDSITSNSGCV